MLQLDYVAYQVGLGDESKVGENSQISRFDKIYDKLALFWKYLAIYHFFNTRVSQN